MEDKQNILEEYSLQVLYFLTWEEFLTQGYFV